jgi:uncharacterized protein YcbK (DUF882 family)
MKLTPNFSLHEFRSKDGAPFPDSAQENLKTLAKQLEILRAHFNKPVTIISGYRSAEHNRKVKGAANSLHLTGQAADFKIKGVTPRQIFEAIESLISSGKMLEGGLGLYNTFVHYDARGKKIRWGV